MQSTLITYTPTDNDEMTVKYKVKNGGICGQACLAVITRNTIQGVLDMWTSGMLFKGYSGWGQLRQYLERLGYCVKQLKGEFHRNIYCQYIARVQWLGTGKNKDKPFYGWNHWSVASANTHFIVIEKNMFFCNETGWDNLPNLREYLIQNNGVITSYLEVSKE